MGADAVYFYYGVRRTIAFKDKEQVRQLEDDSHPIYALAFDHKLHVTWSRLTDGADYFTTLFKNDNGIKDSPDLNGLIIVKDAVDDCSALVMLSFPSPNPASY